MPRRKFHPLPPAALHIMLSLADGDRHGYGIMQNVSQLSKGRLALGAGTLYGAINTLLEKGWIRSVPGEADSRKKEYIISDLGKNALENELVRLQELLQNGAAIMGGRIS